MLDTQIKNPLFNKMKQKFSFKGNLTIADIMLSKANCATKLDNASFAKNKNVKSLIQGVRFKNFTRAHRSLISTAIVFLAIGLCASAIIPSFRYALAESNDYQNDTYIQANYSPVNNEVDESIPVSYDNVKNAISLGF